MVNLDIVYAKTLKMRYEFILGAWREAIKNSELATAKTLEQALNKAMEEASQINYLHID